jgi:hypothetical protein
VGRIDSDQNAAGRIELAIGSIESRSALRMQIPEGRPTFVPGAKTRVRNSGARELLEGTVMSKENA